MGLTTDRNDPDLGYGIDGLDPDNQKVEQNRKYLVLSDEELKKGFVRPLRLSYIHLKCGTKTTMHETIAASYSANPKFYRATYCTSCSQHRPVGEDGEFVWIEPDGKMADPPNKVGT